MCAHTRTHCCFSLVELVNEQTNKQKIDEGKTREREKKKCCLDKNLKKKNVVVVVVASSCTHIHIGTQMKTRKGLVSCYVVVLHQPFIIIIIIIIILKRKSSIFHILSLPSGFDLVRSLFLLRHRFSTM